MAKLPFDQETCQLPIFTYQQRTRQFNIIVGRSNVTQFRYVDCDAHVEDRSKRSMKNDGKFPIDLNNNAVVYRFFMVNRYYCGSRLKNCCAKVRYYGL